MPFRISRDRGRICDACSKAKDDTLFIAWGGKTYRACGDCMELLTEARLKLLTTPAMDAVERYV